MFLDSGMTASDSKCRGGLCAGHLFYPGHHFSYYTIVIPDESDCGGRDPVSSSSFVYPGFRISTFGGFRNDGKPDIAVG